jgi:hypothetical protein
VYYRLALVIVPVLGQNNFLERNLQGYLFIEFLTSPYGINVGHKQEFFRFFTDLAPTVKAQNNSGMLFSATGRTGAKR